MAVINFLNWLDGILWGTPFLIFCMVLGLYFMLRGGFFPFRHFGHILKNTVFAKATETDKNGNGKISPFLWTGSLGITQIIGVGFPAEFTELLVNQISGFSLGKFHALGRSFTLFCTFFGCLGRCCSRYCLDLL